MIKTKKTFNFLQKLCYITKIIMTTYLYTQIDLSVIMLFHIYILISANF